METTEEHRLALLNRGQPVDQKDIFFVYLLTERHPLKHGKLGELLHREENLSVTTSSKNIIFAIDIDW